MLDLKIYLCHELLPVMSILHGVMSLAQNYTGERARLVNDS